MASQMFRIDRPDEYRRAGPDDLVQLLPVPGGHSLFVVRRILDALVYAIAEALVAHLSGPTGSAKTSLIESLTRVPENFTTPCEAMGLPVKPVKVYPIVVVTYETPADVWQRRSLKDGNTYDEPSAIINAIEDAVACAHRIYPVIWARELGRAMTPAIQGSLFDLITKDDILLPDGRRVSGRKIAWVADSNYQAEADSQHTLVPQDDGLKRRFNCQITLDYLSTEQEFDVLRHLVGPEEVVGADDDETLRKIISLGDRVRKLRQQGQLGSVVPPTLYGYMTLVTMARRLRYLSLKDLTRMTFLGNASSQDEEQINSILTETFAIAGAAGQGKAAKVKTL